MWPRRRKDYKNEISKNNRTSLRFRFTAAMIFMSLIPGLLLSFIYFGNIKEFYRNKIEIYQINTLNMMKAKIEDIISQSEIASDQALGLAVNSSLFGSYEEMNSYQRLVLFRNVNSLLSNICVANDSIDNIYMIGFDGSYYTSNLGWNKEEFLKNDWTVVDKKKPSGSIIIPTHAAAYKYTNPSSGTPLVISRVTFMSRNNDNKAISLVQIDISYVKISKAMDYMETTEQDAAFIVDKEGYVLYAADKRLAGMSADQVSIGGRKLSTFLEKIGNRDMASLENIVARKSSIKGSNWSILQINSDLLLNQEITRFRNIWMTIAMICTVIAGFIALSLSWGITKPITKIIKSMKRVSRGDFNTKVEVIADRDLTELVDSFNSMILEVEQLMKENIQKERERLTMELMALNSQINSHFLYNTLNTVKWMAVRKGVDDIAKMIVSLVNMLEYSCKNVDSLVPITEEIKFIKDYLYIQEIRYKNLINIYFEIDEKLDDYMVLKMLLQPIVENAILHGFNDGGMDNRIIIQGEILRDYVIFQIKDNGKGFNFEGLDKLTSIGLHNIQDRIYLNYGEGYELSIESEIGLGTCVTVKIPCIKKAVI